MRYNVEELGRLRGARVGIGERRGVEWTGWPSGYGLAAGDIGSVRLGRGRSDGEYWGSSSTRHLALQQLSMLLVVFGPRFVRPGRRV